ncbi:MAG: putative metallopeptidase [Candidatus Bilamarchaeaceae archaeon]
METEKAEDIKQRVDRIIEILEMGHIISSRVMCVRSRGATGRAYARIWNLPQVWQRALDVMPFYTIEVLSEKFDHLSEDDKERILIHELLHIPKKFSGGLVPHKNRGEHVDRRTVEKYYAEYKRRKEMKERKDGMENGDAPTQKPAGPNGGILGFRLFQE